MWNEGDNWAPLWEDIQRLAEQRLAGHGIARTHFIGAVSEQIGGSTGSVETRQVIDGQQRLTTLQIVLAVRCEISSELGLTKYENRFGTFSRNSESFIDTAEQAYKVWPTNPDRLCFRVTMDAANCVRYDYCEEHEEFVRGHGKRKIWVKGRACFDRERQPRFVFARRIV